MSEVKDSNTLKSEEITIVKVVTRLNVVKRFKKVLHKTRKKQFQKRFENSENGFKMKT